MSDATRASYKQALRQFEKDTGFRLAQLETDGEALENSLIQYIRELSDSGTSYGLLNVIVSTISEESILRQEVEKLRIENADISLLKSTVYKQAKDLVFMRRGLERYARGEVKPTPPMSPEEERTCLSWFAETRERELAEGS